MARIGGVIGLIGGGGAIGVWRAWRQERRDDTDAVWKTFDKQIELAAARGDKQAADRLRGEYERQLEAWRAQRGLASLVSASISAAAPPDQADAAELKAVEESLEKAQSLEPALLSWNDYLVQAKALYKLGRIDEALDAYDRALKLNPGEQAVLLGRTAALGRRTQQGDMTQAAEGQQQAHAVRDTAILRIGSATTVKEGLARVELDIVTTPAGLGAYTIDVSYDEAVIQATDCSPFAGGVCNPHFASNTVRITGAFRVAPRGTVKIGAIAFEGIRRGESPLQLSALVLADGKPGDPQPIPFALQHGSITVIEPQAH